jgi:transposase
MKAYSIDLRARVMSYVGSGGSRISASKIFSIGERTVRRWIRLQAETESLEPKPHGGGYPPKLDLKALKAYVNSNSPYALVAKASHK